MRYFKTRGFIIKRTNFSESDRLVTIFAQKYGKIRALAKGVRKVTSRRASHIEIFNEVNTYLYRGKTFNYMGEVESIQTFPYLRKNLSRVAVAYQMCELVERICPEEQQQEEIYELLTKGLHYLEDNGLNNGKLKEVIHRFTKRTLVDSGFILKDSPLDPQEYAELILERRLSTPKFFSDAASL